MTKSGNLSISDGFWWAYNNYRVVHLLLHPNVGYFIIPCFVGNVGRLQNGFLRAGYSYRRWSSKMTYQDNWSSMEWLPFMLLEELRIFSEWSLYMLFRVWVIELVNYYRYLPQLSVSCSVLVRNAVQSVVLCVYSWSSQNVRSPEAPTPLQMTMKRLPLSRYLLALGLCHTLRTSAKNNSVILQTTSQKWRHTPHFPTQIVSIGSLGKRFLLGDHEFRGEFAGTHFRHGDPGLHCMVLEDWFRWRDCFLGLPEYICSL